ncbi:MAG TPA: hypothetical protein VFI90_18175 [Rubrobacter sp.]|nr:hypothetical protein [Rubrobacter sp.]
MSATLVYVGIGSVLVIGVAILIVAVLFLRTARRYVDLAERRLELLREGQALLLEAARQRDHTSEESHEPARHEKIPEVVGHALGRRKDEESGRPPEEPARPVREAPGVRGASAAVRGKEKSPQAGDAASRPKEGAPPLGVKVAHPDDDVTLREWNSTATKFFQKCYDRYLEHYEGYVRLAERIHSMRDAASPGTLGRREWEDKLRHAYDAIERTTQRLDILEEHYPELATDSDRISSRISTARLHAGLPERIDRPR